MANNCSPCKHLRRKPNSCVIFSQYSVVFFNTDKEEGKTGKWGEEICLKVIVTEALILNQYSTLYSINGITSLYIGNPDSNPTTLEA